MKARVSEKGQVTIPKALRDRLGIRTGDVLEFETDRGLLVATRAADADQVDAVYGILRGRLGGGTDSFLRRTRGPGSER